MAQTEAEKRFVAYHERLRAELNEGYWHFCVYTALEDALAEHHEAMERAPVFLLLTLRAHRLQALVPLSKLLDNSAGTAGVLQLLRYCEKNPAMFLQDRVRKRVGGPASALPEDVDEHTVVDWVQQDRKRLWELPTAEVNLLRDKALAHIDKTTLEQGDMPTIFPNRPDVERCYQTLDDVLNGYSRAFGGQRWTMDFPTRTLQRELDALQMN